jgi:type IV secretory pathway VirJ component
VVLRIANIFTAVLVVGALGVAGVADAKRKAAAAPKCWNVPEITAAKVNELSIKLNVESLRCRMADTTIQEQYDKYTQATSGAVRSVAKVVQGHFNGNAKLYDNYAISVANKYGGGVAGESCQQVASLIQTGITTGSTIAGLSAVAETANINPTLLGGACPLKPLSPFIAKRVTRRPKHHK